MSKSAPPGLVTAISALMRDSAARIILPRHNRLRAEDIQMKSKGEIVTAVDREMESFLTEALQKLEPGVRVVGEEAVELEQASLRNLHEGRLWLVDPLDGTGNFTEGRGPIGVIIALVEDGQTQAGWLYDPLNDIMSTAVLGEGSYSAGQAARALNAAKPERTISIASQFMPIDRGSNLKRMVDSTMNYAAIPRCAAAHYPMLVSGDHDIAVFQRTLPWDHAAGALFLTEAGGCVSRWNGEPYNIDDNAMGIVAANSKSSWNAAMKTLGDELEMIEAEAADKKPA